MKQEKIIHIIPALLLLAIGFAMGEEKASPESESQAETLSSKKVFIIPLYDEVDRTMLGFVKRTTAQAMQEGAGLVVFEVDSPGGYVWAIDPISREIIELEEAGIRTVAFIRPGAEITYNGAYSAASYLSMSCEKIYMYPGQSLGDSQPIMIGGEEGYIALGEKIVSPLRAQFRGMAERRGYPPALAEAMVDDSIEVFEVTLEGEKKYLKQGDIEVLKDEGKTFSVKSDPVVKEGQLLTMTTKEAIEYGFAVGAGGLDEVYRLEGVSPAGETRVEYTWSESLVSFVTSPIVAQILMIVGILGIWIEIKTPGFGVPGIVGVLAFGLLLFGHHLAGLADVAEVALIAIGIILLAVEIFVIPGFGIFGILGLLFMLAGMVLSLQYFTFPDSAAPWQGEMMMWSMFRVMMGLLGSLVLFLIFIRFLPRVPFLGRNVLHAELASEGGAVAPSHGMTGDLIGKTGKALMPLRPAGRVEIDGLVLDVVADGGFVEAGDDVIVMAVEGIQIVVEKKGEA